MPFVTHETFYGKLNTVAGRMLINGDCLLLHVECEIKIDVRNNFSKGLCEDSSQKSDLRKLLFSVGGICTRSGQDAVLIRKAP